MKNGRLFPALFLFLPSLLVGTSCHAAESWNILETVGQPNKRHEAAFVSYAGKFYLLAGRRIQPVDIFDPATRTWTHGSPPPIEIHHVQPVVHDGLIWFICAMTGPFPNEVGIPFVYTYDPKTDAWARRNPVPEDRIRGSSGVVFHQGLFYVLSGIINGHIDGWVAWTDTYNPQTGEWKKLPDAPRPRDHFQAAVAGGKIYALAGRNTSRVDGKPAHREISPVDVFDPATETWSTLPSPALDLPTTRAGNSVFVYHDLLLVAGGETLGRQTAHNEVEVLDTEKMRWMSWPPLARGRHGSGIVMYQNFVYTCAGSGNYGGGPELHSTERFDIVSHYEGCCREP